MAVGVFEVAYLWQDRQCGQNDQRTCPFCQCPEVDRVHLRWSCAATAGVREVFADVVGRVSGLSSEASRNGHVLLGIGTRANQARAMKEFDEWKNSQAVYMGLEGGPTAVQKVRGTSGRSMGKDVPMASGIGRLAGAIETVWKRAI